MGCFLTKLSPIASGETSERRRLNQMVTNSFHIGVTVRQRFFLSYRERVRQMWRGINR
jgi:hypothetical protein